jgi:hypothetical protein
MKKLKLLFFGALIISLLAPVIWSQDMKGNMFDTPKDAVMRAKADLVKLIQEKQIRMDLNVAQLREAEPGKLVESHQIDFANLLRAEPAAGFAELRKTADNTIAPLVNGKDVVAVIPITQKGNGWRISGLGLDPVSDELQMIAKVLGGLDKAEIVLMIVPNIKAYVYEVHLDDTKSYHTNYAGKFRIGQAVPADDLLAVLKDDAMKFQEEFGDILKERKLVD